MTRSKAERAKLEAVDRRLRDMFQAIESQPIPNRLMSVVDQLDEGQDAAPASRRAANRRLTSG